MSPEPLLFKAFAYQFPTGFHVYAWEVVYGCKRGVITAKLTNNDYIWFSVGLHVSLAIAVARSWPMQWSLPPRTAPSAFGPIIGECKTFFREALVVVTVCTDSQGALLGAVLM